MRSLWMIVALSLAVPAAAAGPAAQCEANLLKTASRYEACLFKNAARAARGAVPSALSCDARFVSTWEGIAAADGSCAAADGAATVQAYIARHTGDVAESIGGMPLPDCDLQLATCLATADQAQAALTACLARPAGRTGATGQTQCYDDSGAALDCAGSGQDGETRSGLAAQFVDNGDGTISDPRTGLMWEQLADDGALREVSTTFTWADALHTKVALYNLAQVAGHSDWRLPNVKELQSLLDYGRTAPAIDPAFNHGCAGGCAAPACSCTASDRYWSATTAEGSTTDAWTVSFGSGAVSPSPKGASLYVRLVRGGS